MPARNECNESGSEREARIDRIYTIHGGGDENGSISKTQNPLNGIRLSEFGNQEVIEECTDDFCPIPAQFSTTETGGTLHFFDPVEKPIHYAASSVECIEAIEAQLTPEEFRGYLKGNVAKYMWRERTKGGKESLQKARWYLNKLIDLNA